MRLTEAHRRVRNAHPMRPSQGAAMRNQAVRAFFYSAPFASPSASLTVETGGQQRCGSTYKGRHSGKHAPLTRR